MNEQILSEKVKQIVYNNISDFDSIHIESAQDIEDTYNLIQDLEYDSIDLVNLIVELEKEFDIEFSDHELLLEKLETVQGICECVQCMLSK